MIDGETDKAPYAIRPLIQRKAKAQQQPQLVGAAPILEMFMMREYTHSELIDSAARYQDKGKESKASGIG